MLDVKRLDSIEIDFIIGHPRSGTTLMMVIFNQYDHCISSPEIHHFIYFYKKYRDITEVSQQVVSDYKTYLEMFFSYKNSPLIGPYNPGLLDELQPGQKISYAQLTKLVYLCLYGEKGVNGKISVIVDKNPYYSFHIDKILKVFPNAKIIATLRDYRAYILSNKQSRHAFVPQKSFSYFAVTWNAYVSTILKAKDKYGDRIRILKYERLVHNKEEEVRSCVEFFNLKYDFKIFDFHVYVQERLKTFDMPKAQQDRLFKKMKDLSMPINPDRVFAWKEGLTKKEKEMAEAICGYWGNRIGYKTESGVKPMKQLFIRMRAILSYIRVEMFLRINSPAIFFYSAFKMTKKRKAFQNAAALKDHKAA
jgi:hypothetical protein